MPRLSKAGRDVVEHLTIKLSMRGFELYFNTGQLNCVCFPYHRGWGLRITEDKRDEEITVNVYRGWCNIKVVRYKLTYLHPEDDFVDRVVHYNQVPHERVTELLVNEGLL